MSDLLNYKIFKPDNTKAQNNTPLFILHGLLGSQENWRSQAKRLATSRPVFTLDLRNHGNSPHLKGMSYREMADDVRNVAQQEHIPFFDLLGHSMGGKVAMHLALGQPETLQRLIIVDIAPKSYPLWHQKMLQGLCALPLHKFKTRKEIDDYLKPWINDSLERCFILKNLKLKNLKSKQPQNFPHNETASVSNLFNHNKAHQAIYQWRCDLPEITKSYLKIAGFNPGNNVFDNDVLFIRGKKSQYIQAEDYPLILSFFPKAKILTLDKSGHLPHFEQADTFYNAVNNFIKS